MLVALIGSLSATSIKTNKNRYLGRLSSCLSRLSLENKRQAPKKLNEIKLVALVALVAPTGNAAADKRRSPYVQLNIKGRQNVLNVFFADTSSNPNPDQPRARGNYER